MATAAVDLHPDRVEHSEPVAILASRVRWEERMIIEAFERRGIPHELVDARRLYTPLTDRGAATRWEVALDREIGHTRALYGALAFEGGGVRVVNSAQAIEVCGDKSRTALALQIARLPTPRTILALTPDAARVAAEDLGYPVVLKPLIGSWGRRVALLRDADAAEAVLDYCAALPAPQAQIVCLQEEIEKPGRDIRVIVVGETALGAVYRRAAGWRTNVALGAKTQPCPCDERIEALAVEAAVATGAEIAGVDLLEGPDDELYVLEVNAGVEFRGFMSALDVDVAGAIVDYVTTKVAV